MSRWCWWIAYAVVYMAMGALLRAYGAPWWTSAAFIPVSWLSLFHGAWGETKS